MKRKKIIQNNRTIAEVYFCQGFDKEVKSVDEFLDTIVNQIHFDPEIGYCGFYPKRSLRKHLQFQIFGRNKRIPKIPFPLIPINKNEIFKVIEIAFKKCFSFLKPKFTWIFVFPTFNLFVKQKMRGVTGGSFWKNTILLFIYPKTKNWQTPLIQTFVHEFAHSVENEYFPISSSTTLLSSLIFEGRANNFVTSVLKCNPPPEAKVLNKTQCKKILGELQKKDLLDSTNQKLRRSLFFGNKEYPLWTGYSLGYQIVKSFLRKHPKMKWEEIIKLPAKEILEKSGWN